MPQRAFTDRPGHKCDKCGERVFFNSIKNHQGVLCVINAKQNYIMPTALACGL